MLERIHANKQRKAKVETLKAESLKESRKRAQKRKNSFKIAEKRMPKRKSSIRHRGRNSETLHKSGARNAAHT